MNPDAYQDKPAAVRNMFGRIARRYDLMNLLMTGGRDRAWRKMVVSAARLPVGGRMLDAGAGTGGIAIEAGRRHPGLFVAASDFTEEMMRVGRGRKGGAALSWCCADALHLPYADDTFDAVTSGFLMRNVADIRRAFAEQRRVVKPGGRVVCLDTSPPPENRLKPLVMFHFRVVIPALGKWIAGDPAAYTYLPESTRAFQTPDQLAAVMREAGLKGVCYRRLMFGTMAIHVGTKPR